MSAGRDGGRGGMTGAERLLRDTLTDPARAVRPGPGLLERARLDGQRLRRRHRARSMALTVSAVVAVVGAGAVLSPGVLPHPLFGPSHGGATALRVGGPAPNVPPGRIAVNPAGRPDRPALWVERIGGHGVTVVATYARHRLCVQPERAADAGTRPVVCSDRPSPPVPGLLGGPVGGAAGVRQVDAEVSRLVLLTDRRVDAVIATTPGHDRYLGYVQTLTGPAHGRLFQVVVPSGQRIASLRLVGPAGTVGVWTSGR